MLPLFVLSLTLQTATAQAQPIREGLEIPLAPAPLADVRRDAVELAILDGSLKAPEAGQSIGGRSWRAVHADKDGWFSGGNGYVEVNIPSAADRTVLIQPEGASFFYVNGEPQPGDVYSTEYLAVPVRLKAGQTPVFLRSGRGRVRVLVTDNPKPYALDVRDTTLPDAIAGKRAVEWGSLVVRNATGQTVNDLTVETQAAGGHARRSAPNPLLPYSAGKTPIRIDAPNGGPVQVRLFRRGRLEDTAQITIRLRKPDENYKLTFLSDIDGSVQYYGVNPARDPSARPALVLTLHGAGVEAMGQADAYSGKSWMALIAPTNRRPYGFDWEDWGRLDALEVLDQAKKRFPYDPDRVYLAGHSMGGHGTWYVGGLYPDLFAAIGPSAGWISSYTYAGARQPDTARPTEALLARANATGDTLGFVGNYAAEGVYVLHGIDDDNVPISEARHMVDLLKTFHHDYVFHEQPGVGHWWSVGKEPGADCVDWAPMYDFFEHHALPAEQSVRDIDFSTPNPQVTSKLRWLTIEQQDTEGKVSNVKVRVDPHIRVYTATTANVRRFSVGLSPLYGSGEVTFMIDGQKLSATPPPDARRQYLLKVSDAWTLASAPEPSQKNPVRYGPLRLAFNHRMVFVYGTHGTDEENAWALAKARYDSESFWYRGNGSPQIVPDTAYDPKKFKDRDAILYGNADTNGAWPALLGGSPVQVRRGEVQIGDRKLSGDDFTCLFLLPLPGSDTALVGAVSGTGIAGMRDSNNLPYLQPMIGFPDVLVTDPKALSDGVAGIRAAGFFGTDWSVPSGDFVFAEQ